MTEGTRARNIFVLTGAGVSAESGLGTFRDKQGEGKKRNRAHAATVYEQGGISKSEEHAACGDISPGGAGARAYAPRGVFVTVQLCRRHSRRERKRPKA